MRLKNASLVLLALSVMPALSLVLRADVTVTPITTLDEVQAAFTAGKYPDCIQKVDKMLGQTPKPTPAERANLLNIKAECLLQEKQTSAAQDGFAAAGQAYVADKKPEDKKNGAVASATAELIQKSVAFAYTPRTYIDDKGTRKLLTQKPTSDKSPAPAAIEIVATATRPVAITALFEDEYTVDQPAYKELSGKSPLPPLVDFAPKLESISNLELAATGANEQTLPMQKSFYTDAKQTLDTNLTTMENKVKSIAASAATMVAEGPAGRGKKKAAVKQKERGLSENERTDLGDMASELDKIPDAVKAIVPALAAGTDQLKPELARVTALKKKIEAVLAGHFK